MSGGYIISYADDKKLNVAKTNEAVATFGATGTAFKLVVGSTTLSGKVCVCVCVCGGGGGGGVGRGACVWYLVLLMTPLHTPTIHHLLILSH